MNPVSQAIAILLNGAQTAFHEVCAATGPEGFYAWQLYLSTRRAIGHLEKQH